jgi:hypothetical protein
MSFSSLPTEIRQYIWGLTFEPRILCIHINRRIAPKYRGKNGRGQQIDDDTRKTLAISFTCTALIPSSGEKVTPDDVFETRAEAIPQMTREVVKKMGITSPGPTSLGPAQLYVCSESRAVAMKRYQLAFNGVDIDLKPGDVREDWYQRKLEQRGIWVDFDNDIIFVDEVAEKGGQMRCGQHQSTHNLAGSRGMRRRR